MNDCFLTEQQKDLLRSIVPGLKDSTIATQWTYYSGDDQILAIDGFNDASLWREKWRGTVTYADFDVFTRCGFFFHKGGGKYTLDAQAIIDAVENNFEEPKQSALWSNSIFGEPLKTPQFQCDVFMVMPFAERYKPIYFNHIKPLIESMGYSVKRGDEVFAGHFIPREIYSLTYNCRLVLADCTDQNANVYYELGLAHMLDKKAILIAQNSDDIRFDVQQMRYLTYKYPDGMPKFEQDLKRAIESILRDQEAT